jgi:hypothetical protein
LFSLNLLLCAQIQLQQPNSMTLLQWERAPGALARTDVQCCGTFGCKCQHSDRSCFAYQQEPLGLLVATGALDLGTACQQRDCADPGDSSDGQLDYRNPLEHGHTGLKHRPSFLFPGSSFLCISERASAKKKFDGAQ